MRHMQIFEPAMCCSTGLCGVGVDPELLRVSTVLNTLKTHGVTVNRFNLTSAPMEFVQNQVISRFLNDQGAEGLPAVVVEGELVLSGRYPTNEEFVQLLALPADLLGKPVQTIKVKRPGGCGCQGGC